MMNIKSKLLQKNLKEVDLIVDRLNHPVDKKIKFPVAVLMSLGFITNSSCSGHLTGQTPYIQISSKIALDFENNDKVKDLISLLYLHPVEKKLQRKYKSLCNAPVLANTFEGNRLFQFLKAYYESRKTRENVRLVIESVGDGLGGYRILPEGTFFFKLKNKNERIEWLKKTQSEFKDFADFLCDKITE